MSYKQLIADLDRLLVQFKQSALEFLPHLVGAVAIFLIGLVLARLLRALLRRLINSLDRFVPSRKIQGSLRRVGIERPASEVIGGVLYWIVILFFLTRATEALGLPVVTTWLGDLATFLPRILAAVLIGFAGLFGGILLRDVLTRAAISAGVTYGDVLGRLTQVSVLMVTLLVGIEHLGVNISFLTNIIIVMVGAFLLGAILAFALGARTSISNILGSYYLQKLYRVGHTVSIGGFRGRIIQITPTAVILESPEGQVFVPAKMFDEVTSILIEEG